MKANELRKSGNFSEALKLYKQSWEDTKSPSSGAGLLHCLRKLNLLEEAEIFANTLMEQSPQDIWVKMEVSWTWAQTSLKDTRFFREALELAEKIVDLNSNNSILLKIIAFRLAKVARTEEHWEKAISWLEKVDPQSLKTDTEGERDWSEKALWYNYMIKGLIDVQRYEKALSMTDTAIKEFPDLTVYFLRLKAKTFYETKNVDKALQTYQQLIRGHKEWWILREYGSILTDLGKDEEALNMYLEVVNSKQNPEEMVNVYTDMASICTNLGLLTEAYYHLNLSKIIREDRGWMVSSELKNKIDSLSKELPKLSESSSVSEVITQCRNFWAQKSIRKYPGKKKTEIKPPPVPQDDILLSGIEGKLCLSGFKEQRYCYIESNINGNSVLIYCRKDILLPCLKNKDPVICDIEKTKNSWRAVKVRQKTPSIAVLDGNNIAWDAKNERGQPRLANILIAKEKLEEQGYKVMIVVSSKLKYEIEEKNKLNQLIEDQTIIQAPAGRYDDKYVIMVAREFDGIIVSNDRFGDVSTELRRWIEGRQIYFRIVNGKILLEM